MNHDHLPKLSLWDGLKSVWEDISGWFEGVLGSIADFFKGVKDGIKDTAKATSSVTSTTVNGSHADGLSYVPYDGYVARLHEGETVLTRNEAEQYRGGNSSGATFNFYSPEALDPYKANKLFKETLRKQEEGFA